MKLWFCLAACNSFLIKYLTSTYWNKDFKKNGKLKAQLKPTAWLGWLWDGGVWSVSRESSGCSVSVRTRGGAFILTRSTGGMDWIKSRSRGWENRGSLLSPAEGVRSEDKGQNQRFMRRFSATVSVMLAILTCYYNPFWHLHSGVHMQGLLKC